MQIKKYFDCRCILLKKCTMLFSTYENNSNWMKEMQKMSHLTKAEINKSNASVNSTSAHPPG